MDLNSLFQTEVCDDIVILLPLRDMGEFEVSEWSSESPSPFELLVALIDGHNVVVDCSKTDYFGSSTIGFFNRVVQHVERQQRHIAFCNLSEHEREVIQVTHMDKLWRVVESRELAVEQVSGAT